MSIWFGNHTLLERARSFSRPPEGDPVHLNKVCNPKQSRSFRSLQYHLPLSTVSVANINTSEGLFYPVSKIRSLTKICWLAVIIRDFWEPHTGRLKVLLIIITSQSEKRLLEHLRH